MTLPTACGCLVQALAALAVDPAISPGLCCVCPSHTQVIVWDGACWRWSNQPADTEMALSQAVDPTPAAEADPGIGHAHA
ncbi:hypothetical protein ABZS53_15255 [Streptomyces sp. NPDC005499]|uniref:hypothetical protein n=1 Tax=Streptomyces sp. NPDC005499 TaxID=3154883 RepID=UPI0033AE7549